MRFTIVSILLMTAGVVPAQVWELGGAAGAGFSGSPAITGPLGQASAGLAGGYAAGAALGQSMGRWAGGEIRYTYRPGDLRLSAGSQEALFKSVTHTIHYDFLLYAQPLEARVRPFVAAGGGIRVFRGAGEEHAYQPLQDIALLTRTQEYKPLVSFGGGVRVALSRRVFLRLEARDYLTRFPSKVITPAFGAEAPGWLHEIVPLIGVSFGIE